jgi:hypothetical protein
MGGWYEGMVGGEKRIVEGLSHGMFYVLRNCDRDDRIYHIPEFCS